jgi:uncharacterized damage-inducible protein DinB
MNTVTSGMADLLWQAYYGGDGRADGWHGPSVATLLRDLTHDHAVRHPVPQAHSILELVLNMAIWDEICTRRLGGELIMTTTGSDGDWAGPGEIETVKWPEAVDRLQRAQRELVAAVRSFDDERLRQHVPGWGWTNELMIHGTLHHDLYHAGQIAMLRRAMG